MMDTIKSILIIITVCYGLVCITQLLQIFSNKNYGKNGITMMDNVQNLSFEEFSTLAVSFLSGKGFDNFSNINNGIIKCSKDNVDYLLFVNNEINLFDESDGRVFYGYMLTNNVKGVILFTTGIATKKLKKFFNELDHIKFLYYDKEDLMKDYKEFILNS